jgi:hypothetical protein
MIEKIDYRMEGVREFKQKTIEAINDLPNWFNEREPLGEINCRKEADKSLDEIKREIQNEIEKKSPFTEPITRNIRNLEELNFYKKTTFYENEINGRLCLSRKDIDISLKDPFGRTNLERMEKGLSPIGIDDKPIDLHHIGQKNSSPLIELTKSEHHSKYGILHTRKDTEINRDDFHKNRIEYWKVRAKQLGENDDKN